MRSTSMKSRPSVECTVGHLSRVVYLVLFTSCCLPRVVYLVSREDQQDLFVIQVAY